MDAAMPEHNGSNNRHRAGVYYWKQRGLHGVRFIVWLVFSTSKKMIVVLLFSCSIMIIFV